MDDHVMSYERGESQQIRVEQTTGFINIYDEPTYYDAASDRKNRSAVLLTNVEARWLRDVLNGLDLGDATCVASEMSEREQMNQDDQPDIVPAGIRVQFVQVGMILHPDGCLNCDREGPPLWCSWIVADVLDNNETCRATLTLRATRQRREESCQEICRCYRLAQDFDRTRIYTGRWKAPANGDVRATAEISEWT